MQQAVQLKLDVNQKLAPPALRRFKAEIQWSGQHVVQKYVSGLGRAALYKQLQAAACK